MRNGASKMDRKELSRAYLERRHRRVRWIWVVLALVSGLLLAAFTWIAPIISALMGSPIDAVAINKFIVGLLPAGKVSELLGKILDGLLLQYPLPSAFGVGLAAGLLRLRKHAEAIQSRAFAEFDDGVLARIMAPQAFDPLWRATAVDSTDQALEWTLPSQGSRRDAWNAANGFVLSSTSRARAPGRRWKTMPETPFGWTLLMGRPGSGKSRMAVELARAIARRDHFGTKGKATWRDRFSTWLKIEVLQEPPSAEDAWDAGWLLPGEGPISGTAYPGWFGRRAAEPKNPWLEKLRAWRPRRPTMLLLDDPRLGDVQTLISLLEAAAKDFEHPVRMLVVNQSAPAELGLARRHQIWATQGGLEPLQPPIVLPDDSRFVEEDIRRLRLILDKFNVGFPLSRSEEVSKFLEITSGNPLLVELGFKWLREGKTLIAMTDSALLNDRVDRILDSLTEAGFSSVTHHRAIATATLAGGAANTSTRRGVAAILERFPLPFAEPEKLARVFPACRFPRRIDPGFPLRTDPA